MKTVEDYLMEDLEAAEKEIFRLTAERDNWKAGWEECKRLVRVAETECDRLTKENKELRKRMAEIESYYLGYDQ